MENSSSSRTSSASPSPPPVSPSASTTAAFPNPPTLERLVSHFTASKRSLAVTSHVARADELVTASRGLVEEVAGRRARNTFARHGVDEQVATLYAVRDGLERGGREVDEEFAAVIARLDLANERLERALEGLRGRVVDASLRRSAGRQRPPDQEDEERVRRSTDDAVDEEQEEEKQKTLYDFIDEAKHESLLQALRGMIDSFYDARADLDTMLRRFDDELGTIVDTLSRTRRDGGAGPEDQRTIYDNEPAPTIAQLFRGMEQHATAMAGLLQSLISHYDLCVTALKHTEGGGQAAKEAVLHDSTSPSTSPSGGAAGEESLYLTSAATAPQLDSASRMEMLRVLETDAHEVDDAVSEIKDRLAELETQHAQLAAHAARARGEHDTLRTTGEMLRDMHVALLPAHAGALADFESSWRVLGLGIAQHADEVDALADFHERFLADYARLVGEVDRRKTVEGRMRKVAERAERELEKLWETDRGARREFMEEVGWHLPGDIWEGLREEEAVRWEVREVVL